MISMDSDSSLKLKPFDVKSAEFLVAGGLYDLSTEDTILRDTSYIGEQTEVSEIVNGLRERRWPDIWYELVQGAFDYNDWTKGPPQILITYENGEKVPLESFLLNWPQTRRRVSRVEIVNNINGDTGLRPSNLYLTYHDKKQGETEHGEHGRGLKGATTAIVANNLARRITFESYAPDEKMGGWFGEARMTKDDRDLKAPAHYQIAYKCDQEKKFNETKITVEQPSDILLEALFELPQWFIPLNSAYQFSPILNREKLLRNRSFNRVTVPPLMMEDEESDADASLTTEEAALLKEYPPNGRVEILNRNLFDLEEKLSNCVIVDGWRASAINEQFANVYAFTGWSRNKDSNRNPKRSSDSLRVEGGYKELVVDALCFCEDPAVFYNIFKLGLATNNCYEWNSLETSLHRIIQHPKALIAVSHAWVMCMIDYHMKREVYVHNSADECKQARDKYKIDVFPMSSLAWQKVLLSTGRVKDLTAFLSEEAEKQKRITDKRLNKMGILELAGQTGEVLKLPKSNPSSEQRKRCISEIAYLMANSDGKWNYDPAQQALLIELDDSMLLDFPNNMSELGDLNKLVGHLYTLFGNAITVNIKAQMFDDGVYFAFTYNSQEDSLGNHSLLVHRGKLMPNNSRSVILKIGNNRSDEDFSADSKRILEKFFSELKLSLKEISSADGKINLDAFQKSQMSKYHPQTQLIIEMQRQKHELGLRLGEQLALTNEIRKAAGLLPLTIDNGSLRSSKDNQQTNENTVSGMTRLFGKNRVDDSSKSTQPEKGDVRVYDRSLKLGDPDELWGLSSVGEKDRLLQLAQEQSLAHRLIQQLRMAMEEQLHAQIDPDLSFNPGSYKFEVNNYLIHSIDRSFSNISVKDYRPLNDLPFGRQNDAVSITFNKDGESPSARALPCPYGFEPVGYYHSSSKRKIKFSGMPQRGVFSFFSPNGVEAGLTIYFRPIHNFADKTEPDESEKSIKVAEQDLESYWQKLISELRVSSLTDKQKVDILLRAWKRNQVYRKNQSTFDQYHGLSGIELATTVVNRSEGNCGYIDLGFVGLVSTLFPTRSVKSFLFSGKGLDINESRHGLSQVYFGGRWVAIEAQGRYVERGYQIEPIPDNEWDKFESLITDVPPGSINGLQEVGDAMFDFGKIKEEIIASLPLAAIIASLKTLGLDSETLLDKIEYLFTNDESISKREMNLKMLKLGVTTGLAGIGASFLYDISFRLMQIAIAYENAAKGTSIGEILSQIGPSIDTMDNTKLLAVAMVVLPIISIHLGREYESMLIDMRKFLDNKVKARAAESKE